MRNPGFAVDTGVPGYTPGRTIFAEEQKAMLRILFTAQLPPIARIRQQLELIQADIISDLVLESSGLEFTLDYYFRLLPARIGARIISDQRFTTAAAVRLFYCQLLRGDFAETGQRPGRHMDGYWRYVSHERLLAILKELLQIGESHDGIFSILQCMDRDSLVSLLSNDRLADAGPTTTSFEANDQVNMHALLEVFRELGDEAYELLEHNLDLFDFVCRLASELGDTGYIEFLSTDDFAAKIMELRIAETLIDEALGHLEKKGSESILPLKVLLHLLDDIPGSVRRRVLDRLASLGHVPHEMNISYLEWDLPGNSDRAASNRESI